MSWVYDFNGDGWPDVLMVMSFGPRPTFSAHLFINPKGELRHWDNYQVAPLITNEANQWVDVDGCGKPELTGQLATKADWSDAQVGYWKPDWTIRREPWTSWICPTCTRNAGAFTMWRCSIPTFHPRRAPILRSSSPG
jgi:hypothetical protein